MVDQETEAAMAELGFKPLGSHLWSRITSEGCVAHIASINPNRGWHCILHGKGATVHTRPIASCGPIEDPIAAATWLLIESASHG